MKLPPPFIDRLIGGYRLLLVAYSRRFRSQYGAEMIRLLRARIERADARRGLLGAFGCWLGALVDLVVNAPRERLSTARHSTGGLRARGCQAGWGKLRA